MLAMLRSLVPSCSLLLCLLADFLFTSIAFLVYKWGLFWSLNQLNHLVYTLQTVYSTTAASVVLIVSFYIVNK